MHSPLYCKGNTRRVYTCMLPYFQLCILQFFRKFFPVRSGIATPIGTPFKQLLVIKVVKIYVMVLDCPDSLSAEEQQLWLNPFLLHCNHSLYNLPTAEGIYMPNNCSRVMRQAYIYMPSRMIEL